MHVITCIDRLTDNDVSSFDSNSSNTMRDVRRNVLQAKKGCKHMDARWTVSIICFWILER